MIAKRNAKILTSVTILLHHAIKYAQIITVATPVHVRAATDLVLTDGNAKILMNVMVLTTAVPTLTVQIKLERILVNVDQDILAMELYALILMNVCLELIRVLTTLIVTILTDHIIVHVVKAIWETVFLVMMLTNV